MSVSEHRLVQFLRDVGRGLLDVVYPPRCLGCGGRPASASLPVCARCLQALERASADDVATRLDRLTDGRDAVDAAMALWIFDKQGTLQSLQHALKYGDRPRYGVALGKLVGATYADECPDAPPPDGVVGVPLHRTRELERGYNQAAMLAEGVADALHCPARSDLLARPRVTQSQTSLSRTDRWANVRDAFDASDAAADGHWILVDDVITTGATAAAAAQTLKDAGARRVTLATLAMART